MATKPETRIVKTIMKHLKQYSFYGYHVHGSPFQRPGEPDIDGSVLYKENWLHIKLEVKTPTGKPSALQIARLQVYHRRNYVAGIVTSPDETERLLEAEHLWWDYGKVFPFHYYLSEVGLEDSYGLYT